MSTIAPAAPEGEADPPLSASEAVSGIGILLLIVLVLGGIWGGLFTSTEAAGIGALGAMALAIVKGLRWRGIVEAVIDAGKTAAPIMILLLCAGMYSRFLALGDGPFVRVAADCNPADIAA